jgi:hypothetical protein
MNVEVARTSLRTFTVRIEGRTPLLMHNPASMLVQKTGRKTGEIVAPEIEAEASAYRMKDGGLYVPSEAIIGTILGAAKFYRVRKMSAAQIVAAAVRIEPLQIPLGKTEYEIDTRSVVLKFVGRIIRSRARIDDWSLAFKLTIDSDLMPPELVKEILSMAGKSVGVLDYRPQKKGPFGTFELTDWEEVGQG